MDVFEYASVELFLGKAHNREESTNNQINGTFRFAEVWFTLFDKQGKGIEKRIGEDKEADKFMYSSRHGYSTNPIYVGSKVMPVLAVLGAEGWEAFEYKLGTDGDIFAQVLLKRKVETK